jgi:hypothetical protein
MKHTPGPWNIEFSSLEGNIKRWYVVGDDGNPIARVFEDERAGPTQKTYLIAAAPELLEALQELLGCDKTKTSIGAVMRARAAIAKATGEQHE